MSYKKCLRSYKEFSVYKERQIQIRNSTASQAALTQPASIISVGDRADTFPDCFTSNDMQLQLNACKSNAPLGMFNNCLLMKVVREVGAMSC